MKSALWLSGAVAAALVMQTSLARADWKIFDNDSSSSSGNSSDGQRKYPFLPTVSIAMGVESTKDDGIYGNFLLGVSHYPVGTDWSPFYSVAAEMDLRTLRDDAGNTSTVPTFGPQVRGGISYFADKNLPLSVFNAYGLFGYRAPSAFEGHAFRFGVGISSPGVGLMLLANRIPLPWMIEGTCDVTELGLRPAFRFGFSY